MVSVHTMEMSRGNMRDGQGSPRSPMMRRIILVLRCGVGLWGCATAGRYLGPTAQGYMFHATAIPSIIFLPSAFMSLENSPGTATLQVQVRDVNEKPVDGVSVTFQ